MNVFELAEQNFLITFAVILGIGLFQGVILGRGIRNRFPSLKRHATTTDEALSLILDLIGVNTGVGTVIATFISITLIVFLKFANIHNIARYCIFILSSIVLIASLLGKFTDFVPTTFQIWMYAFYQFGITLGIFFITRRKESDVLSEIK